MRSKMLATLLVLAFAALSAQGAALKLPGDQQYFQWFSFENADGDKEITTPVKIEGVKAKLDYSILGSGSKNVVLHVLDPETGNIAIEPIKPVDDELPESISLKTDDFDKVRQVEIVVVSKEGKPVESALVTLTDAENKKQSRVIVPLSNGVASFSDVAAGTVKISINCAGRKSINDTEIPLERDEAVFREEIPIPGNVPTIEPVKSKLTEDKESKEKESAGPKSAKDSSTMLLQTLVGLIFLIFIVYVVIIILRAKNITLAGMLKKAGVQLPEDTKSGAQQTNAAATQPQVDPNICQFCGQRKDPSTGACGCTVTTAPTATATGPRLVGISGQYMGSTFNVDSDSANIGRDAGNNISLSGDSTTSRQHARIVKQDNQFVIQDEGSSNGTLVNGSKITQPTPINAGDEIQIGSTKFRFEQ